ncbi:MAG: FAD-binding protein [Acidimicrobiales bacterium]|nr:MAG: FAD-binding protein [Acidimicrobiales bacterium]
MSDSRVLIVGAGMAGLTAARRLQAQGIDSVVVDKGRVVGGRIASRRAGEARFDHGAQHFSARSAEFAAAVETWAQQGLVREWFRSASITDPKRGVEPRYVGTDGMRRIIERLADGLDVRTSVAIDRLEAAGGGVGAVAGDDVVANAAVAILTPPVPQTRHLLEASGIRCPDDVRVMLEEVEYSACLAVMAQLDGPSGLTDGHQSLSEGPVAWIADNHQKGVSASPAVTVHSTPEFAAAHLDADPERWAPLLSEAAGLHLESEIIEATTHRWRYAQPLNTFDVGAIGFHASFPVVLAGEVFSGARVEGAYTSGVAAASAALGFL